MATLDHIITRLGRILAVAAGACLIIMMLQVVADVASRWILDQPLPSTLEIVAEWWMPALIFLPLIEVERRGENISVDILYMRLGRKARAAVDAFAYLAFALFLGLVSWGAMEQALRAFYEGEFIVGMIPVVTWPARFFLPVAGGLTALLCVLRAARALSLTPHHAVPDEHSRAS